ncbi:hypothetical protein K1T71_001226 [Dendrolimus kikuchii]|uniref:Uncharacterized protein n=1 Tax=Dendrolimus kikuchii TaxID=765133 RepID=A0ACC1DHG5_9NEOP|nr:hypothetical protein K1T71_001226 [Dendrolimus kikuchii]
MFRGLQVARVMPPPHAMPCGPHCGTGYCAPHCYHRNKIVVHLPPVHPSPPPPPHHHYPPPPHHYPPPPPHHYPPPPPPHFPPHPPPSHHHGPHF